MNNDERDVLLHRVDKRTEVMASDLKNHIENTMAHHMPPCKSLATIQGVIKVVIVAMILSGGAYIIGQVVDK